MSWPGLRGAISAFLCLAASGCRQAEEPRVRGVVTERADLPVFIQKEGEPPMQGMPVPEGTDLDRARRRHVLERASVTLLFERAMIDSKEKS